MVAIAEQSSIMADLEADLEIEAKLRERSARNKRLKMGIPPTQEVKSESAFDALKEKKPDGINKSIVSHKTDPMICMYDKDGSQRQVPEGSVRVCLNEGLFLECPICGGEHDDNSPNSCPARTPVKFRKCPRCGKKIWDDRATDPTPAEADENMIPTDLPSTPEARTQAKLEAHLVAYHEETARRAGLMTADSARR
jgi:hypothetical protein